MRGRRQSHLQQRAIDLWVRLTLKTTLPGEAFGHVVTPLGGHARGHELGQDRADPGTSSLGHDGLSGDVGKGAADATVDKTHTVVISSSPGRVHGRGEVEMAARAEEGASDDAAEATGALDDAAPWAEDGAKGAEYDEKLAEDVEKALDQSGEGEGEGALDEGGKGEGALDDEEGKGEGALDEGEEGALDESGEFWSQNFDDALDALVQVMISLNH